MAIRRYGVDLIKPLESFKVLSQEDGTWNLGKEKKTCIVRQHANWTLCLPNYLQESIHTSKNKSMHVCIVYVCGHYIAYGNLKLSKNQYYQSKKRE